MNAEATTRFSSELPPRQRVELILNRLDQLPTLPAVVARLLAVTTAEDTNVRDVVQVIEADASLTATILRMVRRADLGIRGETMPVARAVTMLGFRNVRNAVLSMRLFDMFPRTAEDERAGAARLGIWEHNLAVACVAEMLGERLGGPRMAGEAFVCGLLHDIGKVALDACLPKSYARVIHRVDREHFCICDVERDVIGMDHTVAGRRLATRWQLPAAVIESVWLHHQDPQTLPSGAAFPYHVRLTYLADNIVRREGVGYSGYQHVADISGATAALGLAGEDVEFAAAQLAERMESYREALGLGDAANEAASVVSLTRANRQLVDANSKMWETNRQLSVRSDILVAIEQFMAAVCDDDTVADICLKAARTVRGLTESGQAAAFVGDAATGCMYAGTVVSDVEHALVFGSQEVDINLLRPAQWAAEPHVFSRVPGAIEWIWDCARMPAAANALWFLPLIAEGGIAAGVLFTTGADRIRRFQITPEACAALSATLARALRLSLDRSGAERMTEELLELNRRLQAARQELVRTRSLSMIAAMAAGAAHELNNPLSVISGRAQLARHGCEDEDLARVLEIIAEQAHRASEIVTELMDFAKPTPPQPSSHVLRELLDSLSQRWRSDFSLAPEQLMVTLPNAGVRVWVDGAQLAFALTAIMANAVSASTPAATRIHINSPSQPSDETIRIVVADSGVGMSRDVLEHALDPFYSHRTAGRGRGLGLSRAYRLMEINGGRLRLESTPDVGTKVTIELPSHPPDGPNLPRAS